MPYLESIPFKPEERHATDRLGSYFVTDGDRSVIIATFNPADVSTQFRAKDFVDEASPKPDSSQTEEQWRQAGATTYVIPKRSKPYHVTFPIVEVSPPLEADARQRAAAIIGAEVLAKLDNPLGPSTLAADLTEAGVAFERVIVRLETTLYE